MLLCGKVKYSIIIIIAILYTDFLNILLAIPFQFEWIFFHVNQDRHDFVKPPVDSIV